MLVLFGESILVQMAAFMYYNVLANLSEYIECITRVLEKLVGKAMAVE